jgi:hypothetical protein
MFVIDAATLYCQRTRSGALCGLQQLDGATIKRVIDDWGRTPQPYRDAGGTVVFPPAYQQVLKGLPAVNYAAQDVIYRPRNVRAHRVYGYSPVQQVLMTVNIALRRQMWQLDYFTEGSIPDALIGVPAGWTPDQIKQFQDYWDTEFAGDLAKRRRAKFVPGEAAAKVVQTKEPQHKDDFDEWLARIICFAFSVPPQWAVKLMNRATADNQSAQSEEEGLEPTKEWVKDLVDEIIAEEFASPDLELHWLDEDDGAAENEAALEGRVKLGALTLNEMRDALGLDLYANPAADRAMVLTPTGYVPIEANAGEEGTSAKPDGSSRETTTNATASGPRANDALLVRKYSSDQPRVPAGNSDGGQWTSGGGIDGNPIAPTQQYASTLVVKHPGARTGDPRIDQTTDKLVTALAGVMETIEYPANMSAQRYGQLVHQAFATAVVAEGLPGIGSDDVETTFPEGPYGSPGSIRTDVILRDDDRNIIAIYDVKMGEADLTSARANQLRAKTGAPSETPVIQVRFNEALSKISWSQGSFSTQP